MTRCFSTYLGPLMWRDCPPPANGFTGGEAEANAVLDPAMAAKVRLLRLCTSGDLLLHVLRLWLVSLSKLVFTCDRLLCTGQREYENSTGTSWQEAFTRSTWSSPGGAVVPVCTFGHETCHSYGSAELPPSRPLQVRLSLRLGVCLVTAVSLALLSQPCCWEALSRSSSRTTTRVGSSGAGSDLRWPVSACGPLVATGALLRTTFTSRCATVRAPRVTCALTLSGCGGPCRGPWSTRWLPGTGHREARHVDCLTRLCPEEQLKHYISVPTLSCLYSTNHGMSHRHMACTNLITKVNGSKQARCGGWEKVRGPKLSKGSTQWENGDLDCHTRHQAYK
jgi:hypothetical protein